MKTRGKITGVVSPPSSHLDQSATSSLDMSIAKSTQVLNAKHEASADMSTAQEYDRGTDSQNCHKAVASLMCLKLVNPSHSSPPSLDPKIV